MNIHFWSKLCILLKLAYVWQAIDNIKYGYFIWLKQLVSVWNKSYVSEQN